MGDERRRADDAERASIGILLVDDDPMARSGLRGILDSQPDLRLLGECGDGDEVAAAILRTHPDVVLIDIRMPRMNGIAALRAAQSTAHPPAFLMMTSIDDDGLVLEAIEAGASGFLLKSDSPEAIFTAVRSVAEGESAFSPRSARHLASWVRHAGTAQERRTSREMVEALTGRQRDVVIALAGGPSNAQIAAELFISESTVKSTVSDVMAKWNVDNRVRLARVAIYSGLAD